MQMKNARHVQVADEAVYIGPSKVSESYLSITNIIEACKRQAQMRSILVMVSCLKTDFAQACTDNGITFIGPNAAAIHLMGSKRLSKIAMIEAGVPCVLVMRAISKRLNTWLNRQRKLVFHLMVKASAGGGGRGMRLVHQSADLLKSLKLHVQRPKMPLVQVN